MSNAYIISIFLTSELYKSVSLMKVCHSIFWNIHINWNRKKRERDKIQQYKSLRKSQTEDLFCKKNLCQNNTNFQIMFSSEVHFCVLISNSSSCFRYLIMFRVHTEHRSWTFKISLIDGQPMVTAKLILSSSKPTSIRVLMCLSEMKEKSKHITIWKGKGKSYT